MDKSAIKSFAVNARNKLIEGVTQKAYQIGISEKEIKEVNEIQDGVSIEINNNFVYLTHSENKQREKLIAQIESKGYEQVMEEVAYTWFNRIIAIRFMEINEYLPTGIRVLSSEDKLKIEPDAVTQVNYIADDLKLDIDKVYKFQDDNNDDGLFKYILTKQCNALGKIMPLMFEKIQDYTELLLPDNLLVEGNVVSDLVKNISEEDFKEQVEIIGWLYQYYISEKKDKVFADLKKNKKITKENIPAATQLFTPDWIVKYMVENSLGRLWLEGHPNEDLKNSWKYYLEEAKQGAEVETELQKIRDESKNLSPEDITILDPSMGSGHILVYAFDLLYQIYLSSGYSERDIPRLILEKNIYGLDIDDRAGQLAYFALIMKARHYSRRIFRDMERNSISINVCSIQESNGITNEDIEYFINGDESLKKDIEYLLEVFTDAKEYGSILEVKEVDFDRIESRLAEVENDIADLFNNNSREKVINIVPNLLKQGKIMRNKYNVCITNPPYMGNNGFGLKLSKFIKEKFPNTKSDMSMVFMEKCLFYCEERGFSSMINIPVWMTQSGCTNLRKQLIDTTTLVNMLHFGRGVFGSDFGSVGFVIRNKNIKNYRGLYRKLFLKQGAVDSIEQKKKWFFDGVGKFINKQENYLKIPGYAFTYEITSKFYEIFNNSKVIGDYAVAKQGLITGNNDKFMRFWFEVLNDKISIMNMKTESNKWYPYNKGGEYNKWYGNNWYIVNWENDGFEIRNYKDENGKLRSRPQNINYYLNQGLTWTALTAGKFSMRFSPSGFIFDAMGPTCFVNEVVNEKYILGLLNSCVGVKFLRILCPNLKFDQKPLERVPLIINKNINIDNLIDINIENSKKDWDSFETSWDFSKHPIIEFKSSNIENSFNKWSEFTEKQFTQVKSNEEELNRTFIDIYGLQDELTPEVEDQDITIRKADRERDMKSFISYAVGCMMGRYSLDEDGLIFAGGDFNINKYKTFKADEDAIIPITDAEYFKDDIVSKFVEFVKVVFGENTLEENLDYITYTECFKRKTNETSRDCLRRYFLKGFMEDHLKIYQKRPIYWMFDSGKQNGFKVIVYIHRYDESMVSKIRTDYLHSLQRTYEAEVSRLENDINSGTISTKEKSDAKKRRDTISKQLVECKAYDQVIAHVANQRISIDLDDGVKINYQKFQSIEIPMDDNKKVLKADLLFKYKL